ncbi:hypothetical protein L7F22_015303 [Adiantum nelumboides]|nr:hypothetical protein [Adiantum nelumboides]
MRLKLYWLQKLKVFRLKGLPKKKKLIAAASDNSLDKDLSTSNTYQHAIQEKVSGIRSSSSLGASTKKVKHKPHSRLSQVVASLGCGSTAPLGMRRERNRPKVYSEEEDNSPAPPLEAFGSMIQKGHHRQHSSEEEVFKDCCVDPHTLTTKRWVGACRCINDVSVDRGSTRSNEALLSKRLQNELRSHDRQAETKTMMPVANNMEKKVVNSRMLDQSCEPSAIKRETIANKKLPSFTTIEGSMSDRVLVDSQKKISAEVKILERWSSASVRDYLVSKGNATTADYKVENSTGSVSSPLKEKSNATSYDDSFRIASFESRRQRPQSMTSVSTLSSYDFDKTSHWGSYDATNISFGPTNIGFSWQHTNIMEEGSSDESTRSRVLTRPSSTVLDPDVSVVAYTLSDYESDMEEENSLLHTVSYARAWLNRNMQNDEDNVEEYEDDTDGDDTDCLIDLEANAKAWALSWNDVKFSSIHYSGGLVLKRNNMGDSDRRQRELHAAALKKKYHKEFAEKPQAIVVSSHYEDDMNTFLFPNFADYEDDMGTKPFKFFDHTETTSRIVHQEGNAMTDSKRYVRGVEVYNYRRFAVARKSRNPYEDFRDSMVEMVLQKQMHKSSELEELLQSFLCLNSLEHHELIVQAFSEVWEKVFGSINGFHKRPLG